MHILPISSQHNELKEKTTKQNTIQLQHLNEKQNMKFNNKKEELVSTGEEGYFQN